MYRHGGSTSFKHESRLAECWRDLHVVCQTVTIAGVVWYPIRGRYIWKSARGEGTMTGRPARRRGGEPAWPRVALS